MTFVWVHADLSRALRRQWRLRSVSGLPPLKAETGSVTPLADPLNGNYSCERDDDSCAARGERVHVPDPLGGGM